MASECCEVTVEYLRCLVKPPNLSLSFLPTIRHSRGVNSSRFPPRRTVCSYFLLFIVFSACCTFDIWRSENGAIGQLAGYHFMCGEDMSHGRVINVSF